MRPGVYKCTSLECGWNLVLDDEGEVIRYGRYSPHLEFFAPPLPESAICPICADRQRKKKDQAVSLQV